LLTALAEAASVGGSDHYGSSVLALS
jgi:hypothetical protein